MPSRFTGVDLAIILALSGIQRLPGADELPLKEYDVVRLAEGVHGIVWKDERAWGQAMGEPYTQKVN